MFKMILMILFLLRSIPSVLCCLISISRTVTPVLELKFAFFKMPNSYPSFLSLTASSSVFDCSPHPRFLSLQSYSLLLLFVSPFSLSVSLSPPSLPIPPFCSRLLFSAGIFPFPYFPHPPPAPPPPLSLPPPSTLVPGSPRDGKSR